MSAAIKEDRHHQLNDLAYSLSLSFCEKKEKEENFPLKKLCNDDE
jgi:hypothetical protein